MSEENALTPQQQSVMNKLESLKKSTESGVEYWLARELGPALGYGTWNRFTPVLERARAACAGNQIDPEKHFVQTVKMLGVGSGATVEGEDYFLSRAACYLVAMNGQPSKPEVAAAQAYFAVQTRRMEIEERRRADEKRLEVREKATVAFKRVSGVAKEAGVRNQRQAIFHDARYQGLYAASAGEIRASKGIPAGANPFDYFGALELSAHEFQMNLAADVIARENIRGEAGAIARNKSVGQEVRRAMQNAGATMPERLEIEEPISNVKKRLAPPKARKPRKIAKKSES